MAALKDGRILYGGVGSGKSLTSLAYYMQNHFPKELYIITTAAKRDKKEWIDECGHAGLNCWSVDNPGGPRVTIDSWNNISKYTNVRDGFFIFDEQRLIGSGAWVKSFLKIAKRNKWVLLSATPGDRWEDYIPVFVANGFYKNKTELMREHVVWSRYSKFPKIDRWIGERKLDRFRRQLLVQMPFARHTVRIPVDIWCDYNSEAYKRVWKTRWNPYTDMPIDETGTLYHVVRRVIGEDPSRVERLLELCEKHQRLIVFYNFDYELEIIRTALTKAHIPFTEWNGHKHESLLDTDRWVHVCQYTAASEAWNCITTDAMAFYTMNYSYRIIEQCMGRIDRLNTPFINLYYYMFKSRSPIDTDITKANRERRIFNETANYQERTK